MLAVRDLAVGRGGREILRDLSFDLAAGQALILRGRNGIGFQWRGRLVFGRRMRGDSHFLLNDLVIDAGRRRTGIGVGGGVSLA